MISALEAITQTFRLFSHHELVTITKEIKRPWWWLSGQHARLQLLQFKFESR